MAGPRRDGDNRFPVIHHGDDGRHRIYKDGKFFREIWPKTGTDVRRRLRAIRCAGAGDQHGAGDVQLLGAAAPRSSCTSR
jgi:hypothetical protein